ncbi:hypothetical protein M011DRAFT_63629 [Sporormia fimetaria CBS 119925]|uniref:Uncharacterized protein n=1 Tax=Sporormia fimetaria CBS 119925 TaxID=1340428 RepID=A0A6A6V923_9PLEO|nr:hypothetical protein M011DRAFT_63629 [Sporormia fimetaria CBS 119925]
MFRPKSHPQICTGHYHRIHVDLLAAFLARLSGLLSHLSGVTTSEAVVDTLVFLIVVRSGVGVDSSGIEAFGVCALPEGDLARLSGRLSHLSGARMSMGVLESLVFLFIGSSILEEDAAKEVTLELLTTDPGVCSHLSSASTSVDVLLDSRFRLVASSTALVTGALALGEGLNRDATVAVVFLTEADAIETALAPLDFVGNSSLWRRGTCLCF